jgi:hypothetical protein
MSIGYFGYGFWTIGNHKPPVDNQNHLFMHLLVMNCKEQIATDGCNGQVVIW